MPAQATRLQRRFDVINERDSWLNGSFRDHSEGDQLRRILVDLLLRMRGHSDWTGPDRLQAGLDHDQAICRLLRFLD